jgi:glycosyltransferase involved in cell wall biosynthesis
LASRRAIGLVAPLPPQVGGIASVVEWLLEHEAEIGCTYRTFDLWRPPEEESGGRLRLRSTVRQARLLPRFLRWLSTAPSLVHYSVSAGTTTGLVRDLAYLALLRARGRKTIAHVHVVAEDSALWRRSMRLAARLTVERVASSAFGAAALRRVGVSARAIQNPIRLEPRQEPPKRSTAGFRILFVGSYGEHKGCPELLDALAEVRSSGVEATLTLVGKEMHEGEEALLRRHMDALGLDAAVIFAGVASREVLGSFYAASDVFCLPSRAEGLPMALLEAMAFALPVVATPVGAIPDVVVSGETGLLVEPGSAGDLAHAILTLAADPPLRQRMGEAGRERALRIAGPDLIAEQWRRLYDEHARLSPAR